MLVVSWFEAVSRRLGAGAPRSAYRTVGKGPLGVTDSDRMSRCPVTSCTWGVARLRRRVAATDGVVSRVESQHDDSSCDSVYPTPWRPLCTLREGLRLAAERSPVLPLVLAEIRWSDLRSTGLVVLPPVRVEGNRFSIDPAPASTDSAPTSRIFDRSPSIAGQPDLWPRHASPAVSQYAERVAKQ